MENYQTLGGVATATITEKKSEFIALAAPATTEAEALAVLAGVKMEHRTARHHVYAYALRQENRMRYSDDGEPAKTAGLPILSVINGAGLQDVMVVVARYFGGTLLGTGGLVRAYTAAAQAALQAACPLQMRLCVRLSFPLPYPLYEQAQRLLQAAGAKTEEPVFGEEVAMTAILPSGKEKALLAQLKELTHGNVSPTVSPPFYG